MANAKGVAPAVVETKSLATEIIETMKAPALEALVDVLETILDMSVDEGFLRDLPMVGPVVGLAKGLLSIPDRLFFRKLARFMRELDGIPEKDRKAFSNKLESNGSAKTVGEKVLMIVDQLDDAEKASLAGYVFKAYVTGDIDTDQFETLCYCIRSTSTISIDSLLLHHDRFERLELNVKRSLSISGLVDFEINVPMTFDALGSSSTGVFYTISASGLLLVKVLEERKNKLEEEVAASPS